MWWILQIVGCILVGVIQIVTRKYGIGITSWVVWSVISVFGTYFAFGRSYVLAPTFTSAWFVGVSAMNIIGVLIGLFYFHDVVTVTQWVGVTISVIGGYLIIFGA
jgi:hypothetical protein